MTPTEWPDFLEQLASILEPSAALELEAVTTEVEGRSYFKAPMAELNQAPGTLNELYGDNDQLLALLAEKLSQQGQHNLAHTIRELDTELRRGHLKLPSDPKATERFGGFVYPLI